MIQIQKFIFNPVQENTFVLYDETGECIVVDPGCYFDDEKQELDDFISAKQLRPVRLITTHCHFDHIMGATHCRVKYKLKLEAHPDEAPLIGKAVQHGDRFGIPVEPIDPADVFYREGDVIRFGHSELHVLEAPGHSPGGVVFYQPEQKFLLAGDVLFYGSIGRTDLDGGSFETLTGNIRQKLLTLPPETVVYCGHGPETTIGAEASGNPFLMD